MMKITPYTNSIKYNNLSFSKNKEEESTKKNNDDAFDAFFERGKELDNTARNNPAGFFHNNALVDSGKLLLFKGIDSDIPVELINKETINYIVKNQNKGIFATIFSDDLRDENDPSKFAGDNCRKLLFTIASLVTCHKEFEKTIKKCKHNIAEELREDEETPVIKITRKHLKATLAQIKSENSSSAFVN